MTDNLAAPPDDAEVLEALDMAGDDPSSSRSCFVSRSAASRDRLIRFVLDPDAHVVPDLDERLPGRGMWLSAGRDVVNKAVKNRLFGRAARQKVCVDDDLADQVERLLTRRFYDGFGLSRRAGQMVMGFDQVQTWLVTSKPAVLIAAFDGAEDGRRKLRHLAADKPLIVAGPREELGAAVGRESLVHAILPPGKLAVRTLRDAARLSGFRSDIVVEQGKAEASHRIEAKGSTEKR